jgi:hypothetical protein
MRLKELFLSTDWGEVKQNMLRTYSDSRRTIRMLKNSSSRLYHVQVGAADLSRAARVRKDA